MATQEMLDLLQADKIIDQSVTPWQLCYVKRNTGGLEEGEILLRQDLFDVAGNPVTSGDVKIGALGTPA